MNKITSSAAKKSCKIRSNFTKNSQNYKNRHEKASIFTTEFLESQIDETEVSTRARIYFKNSRYRASGVRYLKLANFLDDESSFLCPSFVLLLLDFSILLMFFVECGLLRVHLDLIWI